jgi:galactokinase
MKLMDARLEKIVQKCEEMYGTPGCRLFRAPGRVNLIG